MQLKCVKAICESWPETLFVDKKIEQDDLAWSTLFLFLSDYVIKK